MHFDPTIFFWIFLIIIAIQPVIRQKLLENARIKLIAEIEKQRGSRVILLVHRQETMSFLGFPIMRYIDIHDSEEVLRAIHLTDDDMPIDLVVHTPGGLAIAATQIARALSKHKGKVTVFVPHYAMSGGTLIALSADEIVMCEHAVLGPLDPQIAGQPAVSVLSVVQKKPLEEIDDSTLILADQAEKAIKQMKETIVEIMSRSHSEDKAREIAEKLVSGKWTHDYPISAEEARQLGLPVSTEMPKEIMFLMNLYPQPVRQSVEYIPVRRSSKV
ncbi:serine protease, ClpP class [Thermodesulfovibrio aggregans]|uniref:Serine protease, ClpP class n=1 Tax=Thermodesulfovibrio aggregans TaxID=86166 RepID=A0A0U9HMG8_9BACT|nr:ATP-dependent Clp protease proteolytic subunit [Thermodesulfovibrio aggregans]GAQ94252.1 serine protease, ClpP class [Thermodesulfovibrio aggregans]